MKIVYYIDTCIWLNLFKREGDETKGEPYFKIAQDFIEKEADKIVYSGIVLKEFRFILNDEIIFKEKKQFFKEFFEFVKLSEKDYDLARKYEIENNSKISFYDYLHIAICKNNNFILITRDKDLIETAKKYINVKKPEEILF